MNLIEKLLANIFFFTHQHCLLLHVYYYYYPLRTNNTLGQRQERQVYLLLQMLHISRSMVFTSLFPFREVCFCLEAALFPLIIFFRMPLLFVPHEENRINFTFQYLFFFSMPPFPQILADFLHRLSPPSACSPLQSSPQWQQPPRPHGSAPTAAAAAAAVPRPAVVLRGRIRGRGRRRRVGARPDVLCGAARREREVHLARVQLAAVPVAREYTCYGTAQNYSQITEVSQNYTVRNVPYSATSVES